MGGEVLIAGLIFAAAVLMLGQIVRLFRTGMQQRTIREAISRDSPAVPELLAMLEAKTPPVAMTDSRIAFVLIALGIALVLAVALQGNMNDLREVGGLALFPILVGAALLLHNRLARRRDETA